LVYRLLRGEELCRGGEQGASACPQADMVRCVACGLGWKPDDIAVPGQCPSCEQYASVPERCEPCPVVEVEYYRASTWTGQLLDRVLEHEFDAKHYHVDPGSVSAEVREGLKVLEQERSRWEKETHEKAEQERQEQQRIREMQQRAGRTS
jgi:hypothetical protein